MSSRTGGDAVAVSATTGGPGAGVHQPSQAAGLGSECDERVAERQVVGPEVVTPGGQAVRLVDRDQGWTQRPDLLQPRGLGELLGGDEEKPRLPSRIASSAACCCFGVSAELIRTARARIGAAAVEPGDLVLLQRQQR